MKNPESIIFGTISCSTCGNPSPQSIKPNGRCNLCDYESPLPALTWAWPKTLTNTGKKLKAAAKKLTAPSYEWTPPSYAFA